MADKIMTINTQSLEQNQRCNTSHEVETQNNSESHQHFETKDSIYSGKFVCDQKPLGTNSDIRTLRQSLQTLQKQIQFNTKQNTDKKIEKKQKLLTKIHSKTLVRIRHKYLRAKLGDELYNEMVRLIKEIKQIRRTSNIWMAAIKSIGSDFSSQQAYKSLPSALSVIYFRTRLMDVERGLGSRVSSISLECVKNYDWEGLIKEAQSNLSEFRKVEKEHANLVPTGGCFMGFGCSGKKRFCSISR